MDMNRKKQLMEDYKNRHPEMGIIAFKCRETGEIFLGTSKDTKADYNSNRFKLLTQTHPNKRMKELWKKYGESNFEFSVVKILKYEDPQKDYTDKLEAMLEECLDSIENSSIIWK